MGTAGAYGLQVRKVTYRLRAASLCWMFTKFLVSISTTPLFLWTYNSINYGQSRTSHLVFAFRVVLSQRCVSDWLCLVVRNVWVDRLELLDKLACTNTVDLSPVGDILWGTYHVVSLYYLSPAELSFRALSHTRLCLDKCSVPCSTKLSRFTSLFRWPSLQVCLDFGPGRTLTWSHIFCDPMLRMLLRPMRLPASYCPRDSTTLL